MSPQTYQILTALLTVAGAILSLYGFYFLLLALFSFKKSKTAPVAPATTRFAVVVAARNEAAVIGNLVDSLKAQDYPKELYDIIVAPNNCTDDTAGAAARHGAQIFTHTGTVRSKGEVLGQLVDKLLCEGRHDAVCVFDADNLASPGFLQAMNDAYVAGAQAAQGYRDSKNPADTAVSTCYSVCYWMLNRFYNGGRQVLGLSALINGCGFMVSSKLLHSLGGWNTKTMTEDYEFTAQCVMAGQRVWYVPGAVFFDEQPLTFVQSWKQRRRWSTGSVQGMEAHLGQLVATGVRQRRWTCIDLAITYMGPLVQLVSLVVGLASAGLLVLGAGLFHLAAIPLADIVLLALAACIGAFLICCVLAAVVIRMSRGKALPGTGRGIAAFALFLLSWMPIGIISIFSPTKKWEAIAHTRAIAMEEIH